MCKSSQADGLLWTKTEGKKSWKKHLFVLRDGNLFQVIIFTGGATDREWLPLLPPISKVFHLRLATLLEGAGYLFLEAKFQKLLKSFYGV